MNALVARFGVSLPEGPEIVSAIAAVVVIALAWLAAAFAGRKIGPRLARLWERHAGARHEGVAARMCALVRYLAASLILAIAIVIEPWLDFAEFLLGVGMGVAAGLLAYQFIRGLHLPRWAAALLGGVTFVAIFADVMDGLEPVTGALHQVGFNVGDTRISLLTLLQVAVTLLILFAAVRLASRVINHQIRRTRGLDATQQLLAQKLAAIGLMVAAFFIGIDLVGIDLTALAVFSGAVGLAVGFGLQKTFGNLIAGIILLMDRSIKPGDVIAVGDSFGHVTKIGVRAVSVVTRDGKEHLIPNENLMTQEVENWSYSSRDVRVHIPVGVAYDCDLPLAQRLMVEAAGASPRVLANPVPTVWLRAFGESSVDHEILVWIRDPEAGVGNVQSEVLNRLWVLFKENGIEIPFPQRDIRVKEWPGKAAPPAA
jgi:small-conductance mechanosensitive channel